MQASPPPSSDHDHQSIRSHKSNRVCINAVEIKIDIQPKSGSLENQNQPIEQIQNIQWQNIQSFHVNKHQTQN